MTICNAKVSGSLYFWFQSTFIAMKKILVPCDFSKPAINAYRSALEIASLSRGSIHLLHIVELPVMHDTVLMPVLNFEEALLNEFKEKAEERFGKITDKFTAKGVKVVSKVEFGAVSRMIQDYINKNAIDLVIMGSHGASGLREVFIGSNAEKIVRQAPVPVLVVKDYFKGPLKNIVFPNTLEIEGQEELIQKVKQLQNFFKAKLHLVWVNTPLNFTSDPLTRERMEAFAKRFMLKNYTLNIFNHTDEERGILEFAKYVKGDLIALGTHGRKGVSHLLNGSLAEDVANHYKGMVWTHAMKNDHNDA